jgi:septum site-determining protein MinC
MTDNDAVIIKGIRGGVLLLLDDREEWDALLVELDERVKSRVQFFRGAALTVNLGRRVIDEPEWATLRDTLARYEMQIEAVVSTSDQSRAIAAGHGVRQRAPAFAARGDTVAEATAAAGIAPRPPPAPALTTADAIDFGILADAQDPVPPGHSLWPEAVGGLFLRRTLRSGQSIQHDGDVCIIGDVNPGAEVLAGGDVVVWGSLRGMVHAGAGGNTDAVICALQLAPTQLRIANTRSRGAEPGSDAAGLTPERARCADDRIVVEPWTGPRTRR